MARRAIFALVNARTSVSLVASLGDSERRGRYRRARLHQLASGHQRAQTHRDGGMGGNPAGRPVQSARSNPLDAFDRVVPSLGSIARVIAALSYYHPNRTVASDGMAMA
jgi:hypothetical protein